MRGGAAHAAAVDRLRASYGAIAPGDPVRLAKRTSNLFRPRAAAGTGLDVSGLDGVISVDRDRRTADVQGMCTYEDLVEVTLAHGLVPLVVPQLRTITLGGAVTGLGIEATSFRNGLPHESVLEMDVLVGNGEVVTCSREAHADLFRSFPNSYGSLGYATRLRIELEPAPATVALRHLHFDDADAAAKAIAEISETGHWDGVSVDGLDGVAFSPEEIRLTLAAYEPVAGGATSDYTRDLVYYRSLRQRRTDGVTMHDLLWRWDCVWFWCSAAFGLDRPWVRKVWPRRWRRSDAYHKLVGLDQRFRIVDRIDQRLGNPQRERVIQDIEVPVDRIAEFLRWFDPEVGMRPVWLCPLKLREGEPGGERPWPTYPLEPGVTYVNAGFWGTVPVGPEATEAPRNRAIEQVVHALGGHKSLYSEAFYDAETFDQLYGGAHLAEVKRRHDPDNRLTSLYDKAVRRR